MQDFVRYILKRKETISQFLIEMLSQGGTVAQTVAPTTFGLDAHGGHGFESGPMSFLLSTPQLFSLSFPVPLFTALSIKGTKSPKINIYIFFLNELDMFF